ncbi:MAG TPA: YggU family protein [Thermoplasmatales archaeon]|nr:YggU family protein [Thermoplasmatales archaeon]
MAKSSKDISNAIKEHSNGIILSLYVNPQSSESLFPAGYNQWRRCIEVKVKSPPSGNKANNEVIEILSIFFGISNRDVEIISGSHGRLKQVLIKTLSYDNVVKKLEENI